MTCPCIIESQLHRSVLTVLALCQGSNSSGLRQVDRNQHALAAAVRHLPVLPSWERPIRAQPVQWHSGRGRLPGHDGERQTGGAPRTSAYVPCLAAEYEALNKNNMFNNSNNHPVFPAAHNAVIIRYEHGGVQLHPRAGRHLLGHRQRPATKHLGLLRPRPHLRLQLCFCSGRLSNPRWAPAWFRYWMCCSADLLHYSVACYLAFVEFMLFFFAFNKTCLLYLNTAPWKPWN